MFVAFIDFAKAFDTVQHEYLWDKLHFLRISLKMSTIIQSMYSNATSFVSANGDISNTFPCRTGVRQGCPLSPLLFCLFVNDIVEHLQLHDSGYITFMSIKLRALLFADDLVLFAESSLGLQHSLDLLYQYCQRWALTINVLKSKVMFFFEI